MSNQPVRKIKRKSQDKQVMTTAVNNLFSQIIPKKTEESSKPVVHQPSITFATKLQPASRCKSALHGHKAKSRRTIKLQTKTMDSDIKIYTDATEFSGITSAGITNSKDVGDRQSLLNQYKAVQINTLSQDAATHQSSRKQLKEFV